MMSVIPEYSPPDFNLPHFNAAPVAKTEPAPSDGVLPSSFHATSNHPEYVHLGNGEWLLARESRMDAAMVLTGRILDIVEPRRIKKGDPVVVGRKEDGEEGIYLHTTGFSYPHDGSEEKFVFRTRETRETPFSQSYDELYDLLRFERDNGRIIWVLGPAVVFDRDSRDAMAGLIDAGYCHGIMAGNALATHDLEAGLFRTGLGQDIYTRKLVPGGHYHHLDLINEVRRRGSMDRTIRELEIDDGIISACRRMSIPLVLAGSIRDDGPLPEVITDSCAAQDAMRLFARQATTVIAVATQLHAIAFGNMLPGYRVLDNDVVRPVFFYIVDMSEFCADKLANRGSNQVRPILTNGQDFISNLRHRLGP